MPRDFTGTAASGWQSPFHNPADKSRPAHAWSGQKTTSTFPVSETCGSTLPQVIFIRNPFNHPVVLFPFNEWMPIHYLVQAPHLTFPGRTAALSDNSHTPASRPAAHFRANSETTLCNMHSVNKPLKPQQEPRENNNRATKRVISYRKILLKNTLKYWGGLKLIPTLVLLHTKPIWLKPLW